MVFYAAASRHRPTTTATTATRSVEPGARLPSPIPVFSKRFSGDVGAGVGVDFQTDGDLVDDGRLPLHGRFLGLIFTVAR
jgi:hypothetical protein